MLTRSKVACRIAAAGALALVAAAATAQAETGVSDDTIRIGMFGPLTGPVSLYGYPINNGAIAYYNKINEEGGVHGRKIEVVHEDGACDAAKTRAAVKKLLIRGDVFMVHGGNCSAAVFAAREEFIDNEVPFMVMAATMDKIADPVNKYIFTTTLPGTRDGALMFDFLKSMPDVKTFAIVKHQDEWADAKADGFIKGAESGELELVETLTVERNATDATTQVLRLQETKPDAIVVLLYPGETAVFLRDAHKYGLDGPFLGTVAVMDLDDLAERAGSPDALEDLYVAAFLREGPKHPDMKEYADMLKASFPDDEVRALNFYGLSSAYAVVNALEEAGPDLTREKFLEALEGTRNGPAGPAACEVTFSPESHQGCLSGTVWTYKDGTIVNVGPTWRALD